MDSSPELAPAYLPSYSPGEYFVFDNNFSMTVTAVGAGKVSWKYSSGGTGDSSRDFLLPPLRFKSAGEDTKTVPSVTTTPLWPLESGRAAGFQTSQTITDRNTGTTRQVARSYSCRVEGTSDVSVPAGVFDTYVLSCRRFSSPGGEWRGTDRYYYSPELNHYVMVERTSSHRHATVQKLEKYGFYSTYLPTNDQMQLKKLLRKVLNRHADGVAGHWKSSSGKISAMIIPIRSFTDTGKNRCRQYRSIYSVAGRIRGHVKELCQTQGGNWQ